MIATSRSRIPAGACTALAPSCRTHAAKSSSRRASERLRSRRILCGGPSRNQPTLIFRFFATLQAVRAEGGFTRRPYCQLFRVESGTSISAANAVWFAPLRSISRRFRNPSRPLGAAGSGCTRGICLLGCLFLVYATAHLKKFQSGDNNLRLAKTGANLNARKLSFELRRFSMLAPDAPLKTAKQLAELLNLKVDTIYRMVADGRIRAARIAGHAVRFTPAEVERLTSVQETAAPG